MTVCDGVAHDRVTCDMVTYNKVICNRQRIIEESR